MININFVHQDYIPETLREWVEYSIMAMSLICFIFFGPFIIQYILRLGGQEISIPVCVLIQFLAIIIAWFLWRRTE